MNADAQSLTARWSAGRWIWFIALALFAHVAFIFLFSAKPDVGSRPVTRVPQFHLIDGRPELVALTDPALFALPHMNDILPAAWLRPVAVQPPSFRWSEEPQFLPPDTENLGLAFDRFMQTNLFSGLIPDYKPEPPPTAAVENFGTLTPQNSTVRLAGPLARRRMLNQITVPTLTWNDVLKPSRVQALVDADGNVASVTLMESSESATADQTALALSRTARFAPAAGLMFGEFIFNWHTVPGKAP